MTTRRSPTSWRRSTRPRSSIRFTMPVALATEMPSDSARRPMDIGPVRLEQVRGAQLDHADAVTVPGVERAHPVPGLDGGQLVEQLIGQASLGRTARIGGLGRGNLSHGAVVAHSAGVTCGIDIQWHIDNLHESKRTSCQRSRVAPVRRPGAPRTAPPAGGQALRGPAPPVRRPPQAGFRISERRAGIPTGTRPELGRKRSRSLCADRRHCHSRVQICTPATDSRLQAWHRDPGAFADRAQRSIIREPARGPGA